MAVTRGTLELLDGLQVSIDQALDAREQALLASWARAWSEVSVEWQDALDELVAGSVGGQWPSRTQIRRARRAQQALTVTREALLDLARDLQATVTQALPALVDEALEWELRLASSQLPGTAARTVQLTSSMSRVDPRQVAAIVDRTTRRVTALSRPVPPAIDTIIRSTLVRGVAVGDNPRRVAATMLDRIGQSFDLGRSRALVIARTEMLDAHRAAAAAFDKANTATLAGWDWVATLDVRTCIGCLSMHGRSFPLSEPGPLGHQQCRCVRVPKVKSWADLGFTIEEPPSLLPDARAWFDALPDADQLAIAGKARLSAYRAGTAAWDDLATRRTNKGWRDSFIPTPAGLLAS